MRRIGLVLATVLALAGSASAQCSREYGWEYLGRTIDGGTVVLDHEAKIQPGQGVGYAWEFQEVVHAGAGQTCSGHTVCFKSLPVSENIHLPSPTYITGSQIPTGTCVTFPSCNQATCGNFAVMDGEWFTSDGTLGTPATPPHKYIYAVTAREGTPTGAIISTTALQGENVYLNVQDPWTNTCMP